MILIITHIIWLMFTILEGFREGFYWYFKSNTRKDCTFEIHPFFAFQRGLVLLVIGGLLYFNIGIYSIASVASMILMFSFFHDGTYYYTRNKLDSNVYPLKWTAESTTSTAKLTNLMTYRNRTIFMIVGVLLQFFIYIFLMK